MHYRCYVTEQTKEMIQKLAIKAGFRNNTWHKIYDYVCICPEYRTFEFCLRSKIWFKANEFEDSLVSLDQLLQLLKPEVKIPELKWKVDGEPIQFKDFYGIYFLFEGIIHKEDTRGNIHQLNNTTDIWEFDKTDLVQPLTLE